MQLSNGDGGMSGNAAGKPVVAPTQPQSVINRPVLPPTWL